MSEVIFYNRQRKIKLPDDFKSTMSKCVSAAVRGVGFGHESRIYITFVSDEKIRKYNKEFRNLDKATDVLSFPMLEFRDMSPVISKEDVGPDGVIELGDIIISLETAKRQSEEYGHSFLREVCFLAVHSILHLLGFDHETKADEESMFKKQEDILASIGIKR